MIFYWKQIKFIFYCLFHCNHTCFLCWNGFCDVSVTLYNVSVTLSKWMHNVHPRSVSTELVVLIEVKGCMLNDCSRTPGLLLSQSASYALVGNKKYFTHITSFIRTHTAQKFLFQDQVQTGMPFAHNLCPLNISWISGQINMSTSNKAICTAKISATLLHFQLHNSSFKISQKECVSTPYPLNLWPNSKMFHTHTHWGACCLSGSVLNLRSRGCRLEPYQRQCVVSLSKTLYPLLSTGSTQEDRSPHDWKYLTGTLRIKPNKSHVYSSYKWDVQSQDVTCLAVRWG